MAASAEKFTIEGKDFEPAYLALHRREELWQRSREALEHLETCRVCPRDCDVNRLKGEMAVCKTGRYGIVSSQFPHFGEEDCLRGVKGSGTIFFSMCNLRCVFCQNHDISHHSEGVEAKPLILAQMMLSLQNQGCHNINFVTPEHVVPQILEALPHAVEMGLKLPLVYNTGAYDSLESIRLMNGIVDIFMPDLKFFDRALSKKYLKAEHYPEKAQVAIKQMHAQVGDLVMDENGLAKRGVLVRHLVMPDFPGETRKIMRFLSDEISPHTYINIMDQYRPAARVGAEEYPEINRQITGEELNQAYQSAQEAGLYRFDERKPLLN